MTSSSKNGIVKIWKNTNKKEQEDVNFEYLLNLQDNCGTDNNDIEKINILNQEENCDLNDSSIDENDSVSNSSYNITCAHFTSNGKHILTCSLQNYIKIWEI